MIDVLRSYLQMATGIVEASADKAKDAAAIIVSQDFGVSAMSPETLAAQVQDLADDLMEQSRTNREILVGLVKSEVDRTVSRMGFVREEELAAVRKHVQRIEGQVRVGTEQVAGAADLASNQVKAATEQALSAASQAVETAKSTATGAASPAESSKVRSTLSKPAGGPAAKKTPSKKVAKKTPASSAPAKKATAKKAPAKKAPAKKTAAKKAPAKKATKKAAKK